jgi:hypothetical protein
VYSGAISALRYNISGLCRTASGTSLIAVGGDGAIDLYNAGSRSVTLTVDPTGLYHEF